MKVIQLIALALFVSVSAPAQNRRSEARFRKAAAAVAAAFAKQDFKALNKYVHNAAGVYVITRPGAIDALTHCESLNLACFGVYPYKDPAGAKREKLKYGAAPRYNCGDNQWDKTGFVADTATRYLRVSELMAFLSEHKMGAYDQTQQDAVRKREKHSRKVVHTQLAKNHGLVFYLTCIKNRWYLSVVDTVASACAA